jgi:mannose-1-phosphate guanylyltransferase
MQALVLAGGEGTRLRPLTLARRKPVLPLVDRPFIRHLVDWLLRHEVSEIVIACGRRSDDLRAALGTVDDITFLEEPEPLGTAGPIRLAADRGLLEERFLALNGDVLADLDLTALARAHSERRAVATLALHPVKDVSSYGLVRRGEDGRVLGFVEKPEPEEADTDEISAGAYVLERRVVDLVPPGRAISIEREVFPRLVGQGLYGDRLDGYWIDIGTPERYLQASWDILEGRVETDAAARLGDGLLVEDGAAVDADASIAAPAFIERGASVAAGAAVGPRAVIGTGASVSAGATVEGSVLLDGAHVGEDAEVRGSIVGPSAEVGAGVHISGAVLGAGEQV